MFFCCLEFLPKKEQMNLFLIDNKKHFEINRPLGLLLFQFIFVTTNTFAVCTGDFTTEATLICTIFVAKS